MLVDFEYKNRRLYVSYIDKAGDLKMKVYDWKNPTNWQVTTENDPLKHKIYRSWEGKPIREVITNHPTRYTIYNYLDELPKEEQDEIFGYAEPKTFFIDIETEITDTMATAENADNAVLSISIVHEDKIILLGLKPLSTAEIDRIQQDTNKYFEKFGVSYKLKYIKYADEFDMLHDFFNRMVPKMPMLTGWNFLGYDWKYLVNRCRKVTKITPMGEELTINPCVSSPTGRMQVLFGSTFEVPCHRLIMDYMQLYDILDKTIKIKESKSLDFVSKALCGVEKIKFKGSLRELYHDDFYTFMYYNAVDSVLVQKIHESQHYSSIIYQLGVYTRIKVTEVVSQANGKLSSVPMTYGDLRSRFKKNNQILFKDSDQDPPLKEEYKGGWVRDPEKGMWKYVAVYDFASLYPTTQRQYFIAPENFVGIANEEKTMTDQGHPIDDTVVVCINGAVFKKISSPTINLLEEGFAQRKAAKKKMMAHKNKYKEIMDEIATLEKMLQEID